MDQSVLASLLRSGVSALHKRLRKQMYSVESYSMTEIETAGLLYRKGTLLPSELATLTKVRAQSMSQILSKMEKHGMIDRAPCKEDGRKTYISLTNPGRKMVEQTRYDRDEWLANAIETTLTEEEKERLTELIPILNRLAESK